MTQKNLEVITLSAQMWPFTKLPRTVPWERAPCSHRHTEWMLSVAFNLRYTCWRWGDWSKKIQGQISSWNVFLTQGGMGGKGLAYYPCKTKADLGYTEYQVYMIFKNKNSPNLQRHVKLAKFGVDINWLSFRSFSKSQGSAGKKDKYNPREDGGAQTSLGWRSPPPPKHRQSSHLQGILVTGEGPTFL